jgi:hypothetical protein
VKVMYVAWGADGLLEPAFHKELAGIGVQRLQVNLDDDEVRVAQLRLSTYDEPVGAVVSVWTEEDPAEVTSVLHGWTRRLAGWVVDTREPLPPPPTGDGQRADALCNIALIRIPDGLDRDAWLEHWQGGHTQVAIDTQATFGYVQNLVIQELTPDEPRVDALVEELFPMAALTDMHAFYGSGGDDAELISRMTRMLESVSTFGADRNIDVVPTSRYVFDL